MQRIREYVKDLMSARRANVFRVWIILGLVALTVVYGVTAWLRSRLTDHVYAIGWQDVPPFQFKQSDGSPGGLAVDLVRHAAERRGIRLRWVWYSGSSEAALRNHEVDLWP